MQAMVKMKDFLLGIFLVFVATSAYAQEHSVISGKVVDADLRPIPGVNVIQKGTGMGTVVDSDGHFKISVPGGDGILLFAFMGFKSYELKIETDGKSVYDATITLVKDTRKHRKLNSSGSIEKHDEEKKE